MAWSILKTVVEGYLMTDKGLRRLGSGTEPTAKEIADQLRVAFQRQG